MCSEVPTNKQCALVTCGFFTFKEIVTRTVYIYYIAYDFSIL